MDDAHHSSFAINVFLRLRLRVMFVDEKNKRCFALFEIKCTWEGHHSFWNIYKKKQIIFSMISEPEGRTLSCCAACSLRLRKQTTETKKNKAFRFKLQ
jgi:hypothetical protein